MLPEISVECGEMKNYKPNYKEYYVTFHGWESCWNEWVTIDKIAHLGTYTINPWINNITFTKQWIIQKRKTKYCLVMYTVKDNLVDTYPPTNALIQLMVSKRRYFNTILVM